MSYNPLDALGIGVAIGFSGMDATAPSEYTPSFKLAQDAAARRKTIATIVGWLESHRGSTEKPAHTFDDVLAGVQLAHLDQTARNLVYADLKANPKVNAPDADHIHYRATHIGIFNIDDLRRYLAQYPHGLPSDELADAYPGVKEDLELLVASKAIYAIEYLEKKKRILFPVIEEFAMQVDQDLKDMWNAVVMPKTQVDLEDKLYAAGHLSDAQYKSGHLEKSRQMKAQSDLAAGQKKLSDAERRAKRRRYPQKLTNVHMLGQFEWFTGAPGKPGAAPAAAAATSAAPTAKK